MSIPIFQVDAFTEKLFGGNPAAVCPLEEWLPDSLMQQIATENNLAETAFFVETETGFHIRWFTPSVEVDLCGHATLAAGHVLYHHLGYQKNEILFQSRSGILSVRKTGDLLTLDFPADELQMVEVPALLKEALGMEPVECYKGKTDYMLVYHNPQVIADMKPDFLKLRGVKCRGVIVTAQGENCDFVSRFFAPQSGIDEDPVTGSAHTSLTPYWAKKRNKMELSAIQLSSRKGHLTCKIKGSRVEISGKCITYLIGETYL